MKQFSFLTYIVLFIAGLLFSGLSYTQNKKGSLFWEVTHPQSTDTSYLFGTFHQVNPDYFDSLSIVRQRLAASDIVYVESYAKDSLSLEKQKSNDTLEILKPWTKEKWLAKLS